MVPTTYAGRLVRSSHVNRSTVYPAATRRFCVGPIPLERLAVAVSAPAVDLHDDPLRLEEQVDVGHDPTVDD